MKSNAQILLSAAVAGIVGSGIVVATSGSVLAGTTEKNAGVKCYGLNTCKGKGNCAIAGFNTCKTKNGCKGKGFVIKKDIAACLAAKGRLVPPREASPPPEDLPSESPLPEKSSS